jgi:hypothetical protein
MIGPSTSRTAALALVWSMAPLMVEQIATAQPDEPSMETLRSLVEDYAHAIETNNRELALWYVHPHSPQRSEIDAALRDQLASYMERARTSHLNRLRPRDGTISAMVDQEIIRVFDMKFTRDRRQSIYHFREFGGDWRIWGINEVDAPSGVPSINGSQRRDLGRAYVHLGQTFVPYTGPR